ncbi:MAG: rhodanese-like domain-containing protein [Methylacidiphilaceae bacterium]|nr:rhodanese-like domain-containing protein [Candidatus Methylacidiphilaceae bacterium]
MMLVPVQPPRLLLGLVLLFSLWGAASLRGEETPIEIAPKDPWTTSDILRPTDLLTWMKSGKPAVVIDQVGFPFLYKAGHIPGSVHVGTGKDPEGIEALKKAVSGLPKDKTIVLYCGCCPWDVCPNIRPAFATLKELGFTQAKVLYLPEDFAKNWTRKGYPTDKGE